MNIYKYKTIIFDCDGVILNSNKVKTRAFYTVALKYGEQAADLLVEYHIKNGGISRYQKFEYFFRHILEKELNQDELKSILDEFAEEVETGLLSSDLAIGLDILRDAYRVPSWVIVSGGDQRELNDVFYRRKIKHYFDGGIFGSPDNKEDILSREKRNGRIELPAIFFGDSEYDHKVAVNSGLDFIFVSGWTEFDDWKNYVEKNSICVISEIADILTQSSCLKNR